MNIDKLYKDWLNFDSNTKNELENLSSEEIRDRFYKEIEFGTGGIRGEVGAGINRINYYTIYKVTMGIIRYLKKISKEPLVIVAYDSRNFSLEFSEFITFILLKNNINVKLFKECTPTPILSFAVRYLKADLGIVITASHNPKEYNGYKIYGDDGGQITKYKANKILKEIQNSNYNVDVDKIKKEFSNINIDYVDNLLINKYVDNVYDLSLNKKLMKAYGDKLKIVYTPLHGTGGKYIKDAFNKLNFNKVFFVDSQINPDGNFPTVTVPNPEELEVFKEAVTLGQEKDGDIIIATDPDCDRVGIMIKDKNNDYVSLTGNQIGTLLAYYILSVMKERNEISDKHTIVKTIVTTDIVEEIAKDFNIKIENVLTGFKYIGEKIKEYEENKNNIFLLGFEESYGYLVGDFVRDKDGIIASSLICEMTLYYKEKGLNLLEVLEKIYTKYGHYKEKLLSFTLKGEEGAENINKIMDIVANEKFFRDLGFEGVKILDYNCGIRGLPKENVISVETTYGRITIRPSGTEPKIKFYISSLGKTSIESQKNNKVFESIIFRILEICV